MMSVTVRDIYRQALAILGEAPDPDGEHEFAERASYLAAIFCSNTAEIDRDLRESHGYAPQPAFSEIYLELEDDFPLCRCFLSSAAYFVASMLILDENESLSDRLYEKHFDALSHAVSEIPYKKGKTANSYPNI